MVHCPNP